MSELPDFKFHPMCKQLKLTHLVFADDLLIFCKRQEKFASRVMKALDHFTKVIGLIANMEKSSIFVTGVDEATKKRLLGITGFTIRTFPIRYLGLPLSSKKWNKLDCHQLTNKITQRIKCGYSKQLSFAGRLQIISAVFFSIHNFWGLCLFFLKVCLKKLINYVGSTYGNVQRRRRRRHH